MPVDQPPIDHERRTLRGWGRRLVRRIVLAVLWLLFRVRIKYPEKTPKTGGVLAVSNHLHNGDPIIVNAAFPRPLHFMAKKEIFSVAIVSYLIRLVGTFPVDRGKADRAAIKNAQARLAQGIAVGIFPEGTRSATRSLQKAHPGVGLLALAGYPVQPMTVTGSERMPFNGSKSKQAAHLPWPDSRQSGVRVLFGEPFTVPKTIDDRRVSAEEATEIIMIELARLLPPDYRGFYADMLANETSRRALPFSPS
jgi:1-acyl-sn-glycerol-3-phosphate acyltransferase